MDILIVHRHLHTFFTRRREEMDFRKSIGVILFFTLSQVAVIVYHETRAPSASFSPELFMVIAGIPAAFILSFASWVLFSGFLFVIVRLLRYPTRIEVLILLTAYGYLPIASGNLLTIFLDILNLDMYPESGAIFVLLSVILWIYAVKVSGEGMAEK